MFPRCCAVLPAAGVGERMCMSTPKQFSNLLGRPLISYTIEAFEKLSWIEGIVVVVSDDMKQHMTEICDKFDHKRVSVTSGSRTRHRSIYNGVNVAFDTFSTSQVIIIHDAVRPFIDEVTVLDIARAALEYGAAGVVRPLVSTVIATDEAGFLDHALDRSMYRASEMPQAFISTIIKSAYDKCSDHDLDYGTECLHLVQKYTMSKVRLLDGPSNLWKVTHRRDLYAAQSVLKDMTNDVCVILMPIVNSICDSSSTKDSTNIFVFELEQSLSQLCNNSRTVSVQLSTLQNYLEISNKSCNSAINNIIFVHHDIGHTEVLVSDTKAVLACIRENCRNSGVVIHLLLSHTTGCSQVMSFVEVMRMCGFIAADNGHVVNGVVQKCEDHSLSSSLTRVVTNLIFDRNAAYNGVTLFI